MQLSSATPSKSSISQLTTALKGWLSLKLANFVLQLSKNWYRWFILYLQKGINSNLRVGSNPNQMALTYHFKKNGDDLQDHLHSKKIRTCDYIVAFAFSATITNCKFKLSDTTLSSYGALKATLYF